MSISAPTIEDLAARVAALENAQPPDTLSPTVITVNLDGTIGADFTGHVHAEGLDLTAATIGTTPPDTDRARWIRSTDNAEVASIVGATQPGTQELLQMIATALTAAEQSSVRMDAYDDTGARQASFLAFQVNRGATAELFLQAGGVTRKLLDQAASSSYLQTEPLDYLSTTGRVTLTWNGAGQTAPAVNVKLTGATGHVDAIATPQGLDNSLLTPVVFAVPDGAGGVNFQAETKDGHTPPNGTQVTFAYLMWGS